MRKRSSRNSKPCEVRTNVHTITLVRSETQYCWDPLKAGGNHQKHGIRFSDTLALFEDDQTLSREDPDAKGERRFIATGLDSLGRCLTVVYTFRHHTIRLISARRASRKEQETYYRGYRP